MSHLVGIPVYWHEAASPPTMDWDKLLDLFQVAIMAKFSISISELTCEVTDQTPRVRALRGNMEEDPANKKAVSVMYHALGEAARQLLKDTYLHETLWNTKAREFIQLATECYQEKGNIILDPQKLFSIMQQLGRLYTNFGTHKMAWLHLVTSVNLQVPLC